MSNKDLKSRIGYYVERVVSTCLTDKISKLNCNFVNQDTPKILLKEKEDYKKIKIMDCFKNIQKEIDKAEEQGEELANEIFESIKEYSKQDCLFNISLTGESMKFKSKADINVEVIKDGNIVKNIDASLKAYSDYNINLVNNTFVSFIKNVLFPNINGVGKKFIENLIESIDEMDLTDEAKSLIKDMNKIYEYALDYRKYKNKWKKEKVENYSKKASDLMNEVYIDNKSRYQLIRDYTISLFNEVYKTKKNFINNQFVKIMELDSDDIFLAVTKNNTKVISTKNNKKFQDLAKKFNSDFNMKMKKISEQSNSFILNFDNETGNFISFKIPIKEEGKLNIWMNFKEYFD